MSRAVLAILHIIDMHMELSPEDEDVIKAAALARLWIYTAKLKAEA